MRLLMNVVALAGLFAFPSLTFAQDLALKRVMLSSGGLGYFEYEADVDGDAILKTLRGGGRVTWTKLVNGVEEAFESNELRKHIPDGRVQQPVEAKGQLGATELLAKRDDMAKVERKGGDTATFEIADGVTIKVARGAVGRVVPDEAAHADAAHEDAAPTDTGEVSEEN